MRRYFFHTFDGKDIFDDVGTMLSNEDEVRLHMLALAQTWIGLKRNQDTHWSLGARDDNERLAGSMRFGIRAADCCTSASFSQRVG